MADFNLKIEIINYFETKIKELNESVVLFNNKINNTDTSTLSKIQLVNFINDINRIIEPIKTSIDSIDFFINNIDNMDNESSIINNMTKKALLVASLLN